MKKKIVVLTGAGVSAESGIATFRGADGLWEGHRIEDVATPEAWKRDPDLVLEFYNQRRKQGLDAKPNTAHELLKKLEEWYEVVIITQNVDNLHEKAGSKNIIHLHGELFKARSTKNEDLVYDIEGWELKKGDVCELGSQLRPHIVWFGEMVPMMDEAVKETVSADIIIVIGTSLQVYPAAGLVTMAKSSAPVYIIDPVRPKTENRPNFKFIEEPATKGMEKVFEELTSSFKSKNSGGPYTYEYPRAALTVDIILFDKQTTEVLLIKRKHAPFEGNWALPGGFVDQNEDLIDAAKRELQEETDIVIGVETGDLKQFKAYGKPGRDPRGHTVSVVFFLEMEGAKLKAKAGDDAEEVDWFLIDGLPKMAFDHLEILEEYRNSR